VGLSCQLCPPCFQAGLSNPPLVLSLFPTVIERKGSHSYCTRQVRLVAQMCKLLLGTASEPFNVIADEGIEVVKSLCTRCTVPAFSDLAPMARCAVIHADATNLRVLRSRVGHVGLYGTRGGLFQCSADGMGASDALSEDLISPDSCD
jgi:hypothetical protein